MVEVRVAVEGLNARALFLLVPRRARRLLSGRVDWLEQALADELQSGEGVFTDEQTDALVDKLNARAQYLGLSSARLGPVHHTCVFFFG